MNTLCICIFFSFFLFVTVIFFPVFVFCFFFLLVTSIHSRSSLLSHTHTHTHTHTRTHAHIRYSPLKMYVCVTSYLHYYSLYYMQIIFSFHFCKWNNFDKYVCVCTKLSELTFPSSIKTKQNKNPICSEE